MGNGRKSREGVTNKSVTDRRREQNRKAQRRFRAKKKEKEEKLRIEEQQGSTAERDSIEKGPQDEEAMVQKGIALAKEGAGLIGRAQPHVISKFAPGIREASDALDEVSQSIPITPPNSNSREWTPAQDHPYHTLYPPPGTLASLPYPTTSHDRIPPQLHSPPSHLSCCTPPPDDDAIEHIVRWEIASQKLAHVAMVINSSRRAYSPI